MLRRIIVLAFAASLWACAATVHAASTARVGVPSPSVSYFPLIVAWKKGFFSQEGIHVEFITMRPSIIPAALSNGEIQYTTATGTAAAANLRGFPFKIVAYFSTRLVDSFVANSNSIARRIAKTYRRRAQVIYPPVDTEAFALGGRREDFYLTASRLVPYKKIDVLVEAFAQLPDKRLVVVGDGPQRNKLRALATPNVTLAIFSSWPPCLASPDGRL